MIFNTYICAGLGRFRRFMTFPSSLGWLQATPELKGLMTMAQMLDLHCAPGDTRWAAEK